MTALWYEILPVTLESDQVVWLLRQEDGEAHPWQIGHQAGSHPNDAVLKHVERLFGERFEPEASIIHSTSWRYCQRMERLLLTYLVVVPQRTWRCCQAERASMVAEPVENGEPVRGDHLHPPGTIEMINVLAHALDHLAWLKCFDERIMAVLELEWGEALQTRQPKPAGYISQTCYE
jgi:hypothetical protein